MGKGDLKSKKGKRVRGSYGVSRKRKSSEKIIVVPKKAVKSVSETADKKTTEKAAAKKPAAKKPAAKKAESENTSSEAGE